MHPVYSGREYENWAGYTFWRGYAKTPIMRSRSGVILISPVWIDGFHNRLYRLMWWCGGQISGIPLALRAGVPCAKRFVQLIFYVKFISKIGFLKGQKQISRPNWSPKLVQESPRCSSWRSLKACLYRKAWKLTRWAVEIVQNLTRYWPL